MELDWQNKFHQIKDRGLHLLQSEKWSDCHFLVGAPPNQRLLAGHQLMLAMASPVFERMFYGELRDKSDPILIPDVDPDAFHAMLEYIYSDYINIKSFDKACGLYYVAKKYMLPHVAEECTHFLLAALSPQNACRAYELANLFDEPRLKESSMNIIATNICKVLDDPSFTDIEMSTLMAILDQDKLNIDSELDLFNALLEYATAHGVFRDAEANTVPPNAVDLHKEETPVDVKSMRDRVERHESSDATGAEGDSGRERSTSPSSALTNDMNSSIDLQRVVMDEQFAEGAACSKLLQPHESFAIFMNISCPNVNDCPLPEGLCSSRYSRVYLQLNLLPKVSSYHIDGNKSICECSTIIAPDYCNTDVTVCSLTFAVSRDVSITGVKVPTQCLDNSREKYTEELCAQIHGMQGSRYTDTRCMYTVSYNSEFAIIFKDRVRILADQKYKLLVMFYRKGVYPMYKCANRSVSNNNVTFTFNLSESVRGGLIREISCVY